MCRSVHLRFISLSRLKQVGDHIGIGVIDIKLNHVETSNEVASRIDAAVKVLGPGRFKWVHPDCGFRMLKRSVADRRIDARVAARDRFLGR